MVAKTFFNGKNKSIRKEKCPDNKRSEFLPRFVGNKYASYETSIYNFLSRVCPQYNGGYWKFCTLSNGGFYMELSKEGLLEIEQPLNYYKGKMSADAASIAVNLYVLCDYAIRVDETWFTEAFHYLRDYAKQHPEAHEIFRFID